MQCKKKNLGIKLIDGAGIYNFFYIESSTNDVMGPYLIRQSIICDCVSFSDVERQKKNPSSVILRHKRISSQISAYYRHQKN